MTRNTYVWLLVLVLAVVGGTIGAIYAKLDTGAMTVILLGGSTGALIGTVFAYFEKDCVVNDSGSSRNDT